MSKVFVSVLSSTSQITNEPMQIIKIWPQPPSCSPVLSYHHPKMADTKLVKSFFPIFLGLQNVLLNYVSPSLFSEKKLRKNWIISRCRLPFACAWVHSRFLVRSVLLIFLCPRDKESGDILIYPCPSVRPFGYRYMVCLAISSYSFGATALIFCMIFIHIMEVCMSTGFWFSSNIL